MEAHQDKFVVKLLDNQDQDWRFNDISLVSNLAEKRAIIQFQDDRRLTLGKITNAAVNFAQDRAADLISAGLDVVTIFEPGFMRRARQRRRHLALLEVARAEAERVVVRVLIFL
jgi:hypothetical protein